MSDADDAHDSHDAHDAYDAHDAHQRVLVEAATNAPDAIVVVDGSGTVLYWNHRAERIFGYRAHEMTGGTFDPVIPDRLRERHNRGFRRAIWISA